MSPTLPCQKHRFSLPPGAHYLNCAYMAPLAREVEKAAADGLARRRFPALISPEDFFAPSDRVKGLFADLLQVPRGSVAVLPSVSYGMAIAARNLVVERGSNIVVSAAQFPSNYYTWSRLADERGARLVVVGPHETQPPGGPESGATGQAWSQRIAEAINPRTGVVALPLIHWSDGTRFDLATIAERARSVGAALVLDITQSAGAMEHDLPALQPSLVVAAGYKTLFGPYGTALASFSPQLCEGVPLEETWIARAGSEDFARLVDYREEYRPGAERFDVGERSSPVLMPMLEVALEMVSEWGAQRVQTYAADLLQPFLADLEGLGCRVAPAAWRSHHLFGVRPPEGTDLETLRAELARRDVFVSIRGDAIRVSLHVFNEADDVAALVEALRAVLSRR